MPGRPHPRQTPAFKVEHDMRKAEVFEGLRRGRRPADIAADLQISDRQVRRIAAECVEDARMLLFTEVEQYRAIQLDRLGALLDACWDRAMTGDDKAVTAARLVIADISRITGVLTQITVQIGESDVDRALRELDAELRRRALAIEGQAVAGALEAGGPEVPDGD